MGKIELVVTNKKDALDAQKLGADSIEILKDFNKGGTTPDISVINEIAQNVHIPIYVKVQNKWDTYYYSDVEFKKILQQIEMIKLTNAKGIIFGTLDQKGNINKGQLRQVITHCGNLELVFGHAIDSTCDYIESLKYLGKITKVNSILTSGHSEKIFDGINNFKSADKIVKDKIIIGSSISPNNIEEIIKKSKIHRIHIGSSARYDEDISNQISAEKLHDYRLKID